MQLVSFRPLMQHFARLFRSRADGTRGDGDGDRSSNSAKRTGAEDRALEWESGPAAERVEEFKKKSIHAGILAQVGGIQFRTAVPQNNVIIGSVRTHVYVHTAVVDAPPSRIQTLLQTVKVELEMCALGRPSGSRWTRWCRASESYLLHYSSHGCQCLEAGVCCAA